MDRVIHLAALALVGCTSLDGLASHDNANDQTTGSPQRHPTVAQPAGPSGQPDSAPDDAPSSSAPEAKSFCAATKGTFCADFDGDADASMKEWSSREDQHGTTTIEDKAYVAVTEQVQTSVPRAYLRKDFTDLVAQDVEYTFAVRLDKIGASNTKGGTLAVLQFGTPPHEYELQLNIYGDGRASLVERGPATAADGTGRVYKEHPLPAFPVGTWKRLAIRLKAKGSFEMALDGANVLADTPTAATLPKAAPSLFLGVTYVDPPSAPWTVRYDDVAVTMQ